MRCSENANTKNVNKVELLTGSTLVRKFSERQLDVDASVTQHRCCDAKKTKVNQDDYSDKSQHRIHKKHKTQSQRHPSGHRCDGIVTDQFGVTEQRIAQRDALAYHARIPPTLSSSSSCKIKNKNTTSNWGIEHTSPRTRDGEPLALALCHAAIRSAPARIVLRLLSSLGGSKNKKKHTTTTTTISRNLTSATLTPTRTATWHASAISILVATRTESDALEKSLHFTVRHFCTWIKSNKSLALHYCRHRTLQYEHNDRTEISFVTITSVAHLFGNISRHFRQLYQINQSINQSMDIAFRSIYLRRDVVGCVDTGARRSHAVVHQRQQSSYLRVSR